MSTSPRISRYPRTCDLPMIPAPITPAFSFAMRLLFSNRQVQKRGLFGARFVELLELLFGQPLHLHLLLDAHIRARFRGFALERAFFRRR